jgi:hypothetical protein
MPLRLPRSSALPGASSDGLRVGAMLEEVLPEDATVTVTSAAPIEEPLGGRAVWIDRKQGRAMPSYSIIPPLRADWTRDEQKELDRLREAFAAEQYEVECSRTDEGDPWCAVHDNAQQEMVLHITRVARAYVVVWPSQGLSSRTTSLRNAIDMAIQGRRVESE